VKVFVRYGEKLKYFDPETAKHFRILMENELVDVAAKKFGDVIDFIEYKDFVFLIFEHCEIIRKRKSTVGSIQFITPYGRFLPWSKDYANATVKIIEDELVLFYNRGVAKTYLDDLSSAITKFTICESILFFKGVYSGKDFIPILKPPPFVRHSIFGIISIKEPSPEAEYRGVSVCDFGGQITYVNLSAEDRFIIAIYEGYGKKKVVVHENCDPDDYKVPRIEIGCELGITLELYNFEYIRLKNIPSCQRFIELCWFDLTEDEIGKIE
jgi:hypothetical protein